MWRGAAAGIWTRVVGLGSRCLSQAGLRPPQGLLDALSLYERFANKGVVYSFEVSRSAIRHCLRKFSRERISGRGMKLALKAQ
jgi:hypothetical protein